jgi:hypothetical protein
MQDGFYPVLNEIHDKAAKELPLAKGGDKMVSKEISYEESLETMNEDMLRAECIRLHDKLMASYKKLLTQPVPDTRSQESVQAELDVLIERKRREFSEICEKDMSEPTTAEINCVREIRWLVKQRNTAR